MKINIRCVGNVVFVVSLLCGSLCAAASSAAGGGGPLQPPEHILGALGVALVNGNLVGVNNYIEAGYDLDVKMAVCYSPLSVVISYGYHAVAERLLEAGANPNTTYQGAESALIWAVVTGSLPMVNELITAGANVNYRCALRGGQTALWMATDSMDLPVVQALIAAGAVADIANDAGESLLELAIEKGSPDIVRAVVRAGG